MENSCNTKSVLFIESLLADAKKKINTNDRQLEEKWVVDTNHVSHVTSVSKQK
jgi:hypothetical protein